VLHGAWEQLPVGGGAGAAHDFPQIDVTSPTQVASHATWQQYESSLQTFAAHGSQLATSAPPAEQMPCSHSGMTAMSNGCSVFEAFSRSTSAQAMSAVVTSRT
jgi:hypothetical protein